MASPSFAELDVTAVFEEAQCPANAMVRTFGVFQSLAALVPGNWVWKDSALKN